MAGDNKTEKPTPKRRNDARKKGQVAKSMEANTALVLLASLGVLVVMAPAMLVTLENVVREGLVRAGDPTQTNPDGLLGLLRWGLGGFAKATAPIALVALVAGVVASVVQVGLKFTPQAAKPSMKKLNPIQGMKRIFGTQAIFEGAKATVKTIIVGIVAFMAVWPELPTLASLVGLDAGTTLARAGALVIHVMLRAAIALVFIAIVDYAWQKRKHEKSLKMTKEELRRESRQGDLPPEVKGAIRRRQMEMARRRMLADVPTADVVVTNPTHYAVALRYDGNRPSPEVVARGVDLVAKAIREVAEKHGVPVVSNPPLARSLYRDVEIGDQIPDQFFHAVAEVLAFVYRTSGRRRRRPATRRA